MATPKIHLPLKIHVHWEEHRKSSRMAMLVCFWTGKVFVKFKVSGKWQQTSRFIYLCNTLPIRRAQCSRRSVFWTGKVIMKVKVKLRYHNQKDLSPGLPQNNLHQALIKRKKFKEVWTNIKEVWTNIKVHTYRLPQQQQCQEYHSTVKPWY